MLQSSDHSFGRHKQKIQTSHKLGCPAKIVIREIVSFPAFKVNICNFAQFLHCLMFIVVSIVRFSLMQQCSKLKLLQFTDRRMVCFVICCGVPLSDNLLFLVLFLGYFTLPTLWNVDISCKCGYVLQISFCSVFAVAQDVTTALFPVNFLVIVI